MTIGLELVLLCMLYVSVAFMVVYLIVGSTLPYLLRAGLVVLVSVSFFASWHLWRDVAGWPARAKLPDQFLFHAATVIEPDPEKSQPGSIYVWVTEITDDGPAAMPRAYRVAYLKTTHSQLQEAESRMRNGLPQIGKRKRGPEGTFSLNGAMKRVEDEQQFELGNLPSPALPEK
ncbi:MAG: hypothetical protein K0Q76_295 [Panacagrimonas sp.]|jgi:hypothetical protein|nr:hypothetical protein [Panacagrimonas sp.]MCC2655187.1 hypothetical protein [Panacagrimonas sp.]